MSIKYRVNLLHLLAFAIILVGSQGEVRAQTGGDPPYFYKLNFFASLGTVRPTSPIARFSTPVRFRIITPTLVTFGDVDDHGNPNTALDLRPIIQEALNEWKAALQTIPELADSAIFEEVPPGSDIGDGFEISITDAPISGAFGQYQHAGTGGLKKNRLTIYAETFRRTFFSGDTTQIDMVRSDIKGESIENVTQRMALEVMLRLLIKHELGHMVGYTHPDLSDQEKHQQNVNDTGSFWIWSPRTSLTQVGFPIMFGQDIRDNIRARRQALDRTGGRDRAIALEDIRIAPQEIDGLALVARGTRPQCMKLSFPGTSSSNFSKRTVPALSGTDSISCPVFYLNNVGLFMRGIEASKNLVDDLLYVTLDLDRPRRPKIDLQ